MVQKVSELETCCPGQIKASKVCNLLKTEKKVRDHIFHLEFSAKIFLLYLLTSSFSENQEFGWNFPTQSAPLQGMISGNILLAVIYGTALQNMNTCWHKSNNFFMYSSLNQVACANKNKKIAIPKWAFDFLSWESLSNLKNNDNLIPSTYKNPFTFETK